MRAWNPMLFRDFRDPLYDGMIGFGCRIVLTFRNLIGFGTKSLFRRPVTGQSSRGEWTIGNHPDLLCATKRQHFSFFFTVDQVNMILHGDEASPAVHLSRVQGLLELPGE